MNKPRIVIASMALAILLLPARAGAQAQDVYLADNMAPNLGAAANVQRFDGTTGAYAGPFTQLTDPYEYNALDNYASWMAFGPDGNLYLSSMNTYSIDVYAGGTGAYLRSLPVGGYCGFAFGSDGLLYTAADVSLDGVEPVVGTIRRFALDGTVVPGSQTLGRWGSTGQNDYPTSPAFAPDGSLYVDAASADYSHHVIKGFASNGDFLGTVLDNPDWGYIGSLGFGPGGYLYANVYNPTTASAEFERIDVQTGAHSPFIAHGAFGWAMGPDGNLYLDEIVDPDLLTFRIEKYDGLTGADLGPLAPASQFGGPIAFGPHLAPVPESASLLALAGGLVALANRRRIGRRFAA